MNYVFFCFNDRKYSPQEISRLKAMSSFEVGAANRFLRWEDQQAFILGRVLLSWGCKKLGVPDAHRKEISFDRHKRPYLPGGIDFNISHSGKFVLCTISDSERVGVDVEQMRHVDVAEFKDFFSAGEYEAILQASNPNAQFFLYWTLKEAAIKADGRGLSIPLSKVIIQDDTVQVEDTRWYPRRLHLDPDHPAHVVSDKPGTAFVNEHVTLHDFIEGDSH